MSVEGAGVFPRSEGAGEDAATLATAACLRFRWLCVLGGTASRAGEWSVELKTSIVQSLMRGLTSVEGSVGGRSDERIERANDGTFKILSIYKCWCWKRLVIEVGFECVLSGGTGDGAQAFVL